MEAGKDYPAKNTRKKGGKQSGDQESQVQASQTLIDDLKISKTPKTPRKRRGRKKSSPPSSTTAKKPVKDIRNYFPDSPQVHALELNGHGNEHSHDKEIVSDPPVNITHLTLNESEILNSSSAGLSSNSFYSTNSSFEDNKTDNTCNRSPLSANTTVEFEATLNWTDNEVISQNNTDAESVITSEGTEDKNNRRGTSDAEAEQTDADKATIDTMDKSDTQEIKEAKTTKDQSQQQLIDMNKNQETPTEGNCTVNTTDKMSKVTDTCDLAELLQGKEGMERVEMMFSTLLTNMNSMKTTLQEDIQKLREEKETVTQQVTKIEAEQQKQQVTNMKNTDDIKYCQVKMIQMAEVIQYQGQKIDELNEKVERMETENLRPNLIIQGILETPNENCKESVTNFFQSTMGITKSIFIKKAYRMGKVKAGKHRPLSITLVNETDKAIIYCNVATLQNKTNELKMKYKIDDQLPSKAAEKRKSNRNWMWKNKKSVARKLEMSVKRNQLIANNRQVISKIIKPDPIKLMKLKKDEIVEIEKIGKEVTKGSSIQVETSKFQGYVCDASSFEDVNRAYEWVKYQNLSARHVICACKLPGKNILESEAYEDDDEHGAGRMLLDYLDSIKAENRAVFVSREYDGKHIGPQRHGAITNAAKKVINNRPYNTHTKSYQFSWAKERSKEGAEKPGSDSDDSSEVEFGAVGGTHSPIKGSWAELSATTVEKEMLPPNSNTGCDDSWERNAQTSLP